jgi:glycosyltransferase involved in cell wall biosynthesis
MPARVTIAVPSFNQGKFLDQALASIFEQDLAKEVFVADGGSTDESLSIIEKWAPRLSGWRSHRDAGQAAAINECISLGSAPFVCWVNSDDWLLPGGIARLLAALESHPAAPAAYARAWNFFEGSRKMRPVWVERFSERRLAWRCIVSQPATLIRRTAWESTGGVDPGLYMAMDYDLWWRLYREFGPLQFVDAFTAVNREHDQTKTRSNRRLHYDEAIGVVRKYHGRVPLKWWVAQPYSVWLRGLMHRWHGGDS